MNKIALFAIFGFIILLLAGCAQQPKNGLKETTPVVENKTTEAALPAAGIGEGDQQVSDEDAAQSAEDQNATEELDQLITELG